MKVKNNTNKPIGIGVLNLLPGQTETLPAPYEKHPVVQMLSKKKYDEDHTFISLIEDKAPAKGAAKSPKKESAKAEAAKGAETGSDE